MQRMRQIPSSLLKKGTGSEPVTHNRQIPVTRGACPLFQRPASLAIAAPLAGALAVIAVASPREARQALLNSAILAAGALAIALPAGTLLATLLFRFDLPGRPGVIAALGILLFLPLYVQLSGWDAALGKLGWYTLAHGSLVEPLLAGMRGAIFVHGLAAVPWVALIVGLGLSQADLAQEEAALLTMPPRAVLRYVTLPQIFPFFIAAALWTIVSTTSEMTVTNIYLINPAEWTYTERFYMRMASSDATQAAIAVLPAVCGLALTVVSALIVVTHLSQRRVLATSARVVIFSAGQWRPLAVITLWLLVGLLLAVPIGSLISKAGFVVIRDGSLRHQAWSALACLREVVAVPVKFHRELIGTALVATLAATLAVGGGAILAWRARRGGPPALLTTVVTALALAIPGPLIGAALIQLLNHDLPPWLPLPDGSIKSWLLLLYDQSPFAPALAQAIRAAPLAILLLWHSFATLDDDVLAAAALDGLSPRRVFWLFAVPQRWRAFAAAWIGCFAVAAGDLAWAHLVTPPGLDLISRRVFGLVHSGVEEQVAAISLVNILVYALLAIATMRLLKPSRRQSAFRPPTSDLRPRTSIK